MMMIIDEIDDDYNSGAALWKYFLGDRKEQH
jgi:hypothetical protein